jgi:hypothetical protein
MTIDRKEMNQRLIRLAEDPNTRFWRVEYNQLSFPERVFGLIWELESEVNNGGFRQYFLNSTGTLAPHVIDALNAVGAARTAALVQEALAQVGDNIPWSDDIARRAMINSLSLQIEEKLNELDQVFYVSPPDDLTTLIRRASNRNSGAQEFLGRVELK